VSTEPVVVAVAVTVDPERAFATLTEDIADWWPLDRMGVFGDGTVAFDEDAIVEESPDGEQTTWGEVTTWSPPHDVEFTWHPGRDDGPVTSVHVSIAPGERGGSVVTLVHDGWDDLENGSAMRDEYEQGWTMILGRYAVRADA
jgi:uncharacterized protein YndB with AHSA1/START domain